MNSTYQYNKKINKAYANILKENENIIVKYYYSSFTPIESDDYKYFIKQFTIFIRNNNGTCKNIKDTKEYASGYFIVNGIDKNNFIKLLQDIILQEYIDSEGNSITNYTFNIDGYIIDNKSEYVKTRKYIQQIKQKDNEFKLAYINRQHFINKIEKKYKKQFIIGNYIKLVTPQSFLSTYKESSLNLSYSIITKLEDRGIENNNTPDVYLSRAIYEIEASINYKNNKYTIDEIEIKNNDTTDNLGFSEYYDILLHYFVDNNIIYNFKNILENKEDYYCNILTPQEFKNEIMIIKSDVRNGIKLDIIATKLSKSK